jgi:hypothetical protein
MLVSTKRWNKFISILLKQAVCSLYQQPKEKMYDIWNISWLVKTRQDIIKILAFYRFE